jgi:hypothetical protein
MKLLKFLNQHEIKCKTCNMMISIEQLSNHKLHDVRIRERMKYFIIDIVINTVITLLPMGIMAYFLLEVFNEYMKLRSSLSI